MGPSRKSGTALILAGMLGILVLGLGTFGSAELPSSPPPLDGSPVIDVLDFRNTEVGEILRVLSDQTGWSIFVSPKITAKVTLSAKDISAAEFLDNLVKVSGNRVIRDGNVVLVVTPDEYDALEGGNFKVFTLEASDPEAAAATVQGLLTKQGRVMADSRSHQLVIVDTEANAASIEKILKELDKSVVTDVIDLGVAKATDVATKLQNVVSNPQNVVADDRTHRLIITDTNENLNAVSKVIEKLDREIPTEVFSLQHASAEDAAKVLGMIASAPENVQADPRTNRLIVRDTAGVIDQIRATISQLDQPDNSEMRVIPLRFADSTAMASLLTEIMGAPEQAVPRPGPQAAERSPSPEGPNTKADEAQAEAGSQGSSGSERASPALPAAPTAEPSSAATSMGSPMQIPGTSSSTYGFAAVAEERTNSIVISGSPAALDRMEKVVHELDIEVATHFVQLHHADPEAIGLEDKLAQILTGPYDTYQIETVSRQVSFTTTEDKASRLKVLLAEWDRKPGQVLIEAKLMRVGIDTARDLGISFTAQEAGKGTAAIKATGVFPPGIPSAPMFSLEGGSLSKTDYTFLIQALETSGDSELLSNPRILVIDGHQADFSVATEEPYTEVTIGEAGGTVTENVQFKEVGVVLTVVPHISDVGSITMDVLLEVSDLVEVRDGLPVINRSRGTSRVVAEDSRTVLLGGLIVRDRTKILKGIPLISRIPILGIPFRSTSHSFTKSELILFLTPHITSGEQIPPGSYEEARQHMESSTAKP